MSNPSDTSEGRTIFIRNLPFDLDNDTLYTYFADFGSLEFAKIVKDPISLHPRGTGFVKFTHQADASRVLLESTQPEAGQLRGRSMAPFETKTEDVKSVVASKPTAVVEKLHQQGRNLHLARIGMIRAGTTSAEGLPKEDLARRDQLLRIKKDKLRDPNIFISDTRLCVRNLPLTATDEQLRDICADILGEMRNLKRRIPECRVMRNMEPGKHQLRSLGFAFIELQTHKDALQVLHKLNNNPDLFKCKRRPIVEFSLENMRALMLKSRRAERCVMSHQKPENVVDGSARSNEVQPPRQRRGLPQQPQVARRRSSGPSGNKSNAANQRVLPKRFGPKNRHRDRAKKAKSVQSNKPKDRLSRQAIRTKQKKRKQ